jgi:mannose-6-phosphate isomerase-like protein (cupin superfamily)
MLRPVEVARLSELAPFVTKDGSTIRELAGPAWTAARNQSLAEASVPSGGETDEHYHVEAEELYYFVSGAGRMRLGEDEQDVAAGDCVVIPPDVRHKLWNPGQEPLALLCCCAPAYHHDDTVMTGG